MRKNEKNGSIFIFCQWYFCINKPKKAFKSITYLKLHTIYGIIEDVVQEKKECEVYFKQAY